MTPADRTHVRGRSQATGSNPPVPSPSPLHTGPDCAECARLAEQLRAAHLSGDRSRVTDVRVFQARHYATAARRAGAA
jgi:hypothetical protein